MARNRVSPGSWKSRKAPALDVIGPSETLIRAGTGIAEAVIEGATDGEEVCAGDAAERVGSGTEAVGTQATTDVTRKTTGVSDTRCRMPFMMPVEPTAARLTMRCGASGRATP